MQQHHLSLLLLLLLLPTTASLGVTYSNNRQQPDRIAAAMQTLKLTSIRLKEPDPAIMRSLLYSNISIFLTVPNHMVTSMANNLSTARAWIYTHVVPYYPRAKITTISVGNAFIDVYPQAANNLLLAISNIQVSLRDLGIRKIAVSTSFSFDTVVTSPFPPSSATFQDPAGVNLMGSLLEFLSDNNFSFLINLYPYNLYRLHPEIPLGLALFQENSFNFHDDVTTRSRYWNLFDMMVDAVASAMAEAGYETIPIVVTETGWPSSDAADEFNANLGYAETYLRGLVNHLSSGTGTPLLKDGVQQVYVYELFDRKGTTTGRDWGILYPNGTAKYHVDFSAVSSRSSITVALVIFWLLVQLVY
ncbi:probable glucan endo-1,3-beta-glucosidase A6 [Lotus japonicus]|uniref:probable glucan endo-1,3-beta-glucosidase A6 n=1 Tax=Lotus japonicus TaxID=34305 RepID=UPI00258B8356|nr:probable glucan endo-1,3-beta-glucosidase A6 [Lotus japonicus]